MTDVFPPMDQGTQNQQKPEKEKNKTPKVRAKKKKVLPKQRPKPPKEPPTSLREVYNGEGCIVESDKTILTRVTKCADGCTCTPSKAQLGVSSSGQGHCHGTCKFPKPLPLLQDKRTQHTKDQNGESKGGIAEQHKGQNSKDQNGESKGGIAEQHKGQNSKAGVGYYDYQSQDLYGVPHFNYNPAHSH
eukprot:365479_1